MCSKLKLCRKNDSTDYKCSFFYLKLGLDNQSLLFYNHDSIQQEHWAVGNRWFSLTGRYSRWWETQVCEISWHMLRSVAVLAPQSTATVNRPLPNFSAFNFCLFSFLIAMFDFNHNWITIARRARSISLQLCIRGATAEEHCFFAHLPAFYVNSLSVSLIHASKSSWLWAGIHSAVSQTKTKNNAALWLWLTKVLNHANTTQMSCFVN